MKNVDVGPFSIGSGCALTLISGPCVIESRDLVLRVGENVAEQCRSLGFSYVLKASFDKANRTRVDSFRGLGIDEGLRILEDVKKSLGVPVLTDVHESHQCRPVAEVADILQIPAFLCRQTDLLVAAAETQRPINIKKGQFMSPEGMSFAVDKIRSVRKLDALNVLLTERGTFFGYHDLVVDFRNLSRMRKHAPVVFDATHSVQKPAGGSGVTDGSREDVRALSRAAVAAGVDALFLEVHPDPSRALSDGATSLSFEQLEPLLRDVRGLESGRRAYCDLNIP